MRANSGELEDSRQSHSQIPYRPQGSKERDEIEVCHGKLRANPLITG